MADRHWLEPPEWWKKYKPLRWLAILGMAFFAFSAFYTAKKLVAPGEHPETAAFLDAAPDPVDFINGLASYQSVTDVSDMFKRAKLPVSVESDHRARNPKYPPRDLDSMTVSDKYVMLGVPGTLNLEFINDHLYEMTFFPSDAATFAQALHESDPRLPRQRNNRIEFRDGPLRIASNVDFAATDVGKNLDTKAYIVWQDTRLVDLRDDWDRRFVYSASDD